MELDYRSFIYRLLSHIPVLFILPGVSSLIEVNLNRDPLHIVLI